MRSATNAPIGNGFAGRRPTASPAASAPTPTAVAAPPPSAGPPTKPNPGKKQAVTAAPVRPNMAGRAPVAPCPTGLAAGLLAKCVPVRSLRSKRIVFTFCAVILTAGFLLVAFCGSFRWGFISPGPLSLQHATFTFAHRAKAEAAGNCSGLPPGRARQHFHLAAGGLPGPARPLANPRPGRAGASRHDGH